MQSFQVLNLFRSLCFMALVFFVAAPTMSAQDKATQIDQLMEKYTAYGQFNGSVLVAEKGKVIFKKGYGMANMEWEIPNAADTKHRLGSISKQFSTMLIMQLVEEGKLKLDVPISTYLPDYPKATGDQINLHHLMTHSAGIPNYTSFPNFFAEKSRDPFTPAEFVKEFANLPLEFEPGAQFSYSNSGYFLMGYIIEEITGKTYEENLTEKILVPAKMKNTGYDHHNQILKNRAAGYEKDGISYINADYLDMSIPYAAGSLYSTVEDLFLWDRALTTTLLLSPEMKEILFEKHIPSRGGHYGYGWSIDKQKMGNSNMEKEVIGHGGGINGFNTLISRMPADDNFIVLLNNTGGAELGKMTRAIAGIIYGTSYDIPKQSVAYSTMAIVEEEDLAAGMAHFKKVKDLKEYSFDEREMNSVGYQLLAAEKTEEALAFFKINVDAFPDSWNVYDSYGEALLKKGDQANAILNYKKSVTLNPGNAGGIEQLKKLGVDLSDVIKEVVLDDATLASYVGQYKLAPEFIITIRKDGDQLTAQATGQPESAIFPKGNDVFYLKVVVADLVFSRNDQGEVDKVTLHQGGREMPGDKM